MPYDTWPCKIKWFFDDIDEIPDPDFTLLLEGSYFTLFVGGSTLYGIVTPPSATDSSFYCHIYSDSARTQEITAGDYTGEVYRMEFFGGWKFQNRDRFNERDFSGSGRWVSNDVRVYANGGYFDGQWVVLDYTEASVTLFDGTWTPNSIGIYDLQLTEQAAGSLPADTYTVHVSGVDSLGREGGASYEQISVGSNAKIDVSWKLNAQAVTYNVYLNCQLQSSGNTGGITIGDLTLEDPGQAPPPVSDPAIPDDPDAPIITVISPDDPGQLPGGKVIGTDPGGVDYQVVVTPGVPIDPNFGGKVLETRTEQVGDCLETKTFEDGVQTGWTKLCTDPVTGQQSFCVGTLDTESVVPEDPLSYFYDGVPSVLTNPEGTEYGPDTYPITPKNPPDVEYRIQYPVQTLHDVANLSIDDPPLGGRVVVAYVRDPTPGNPNTAYEAIYDSNNSWDTTPVSPNWPEDVHSLEFSADAGDEGDDQLIPETEWTNIRLRPFAIWTFECQAVEQAVEPQVGSCRSVTSFADTFNVAGTLYGTRTDEVQCSNDPFNASWLDLSYLSDLLLKVFGVGAPIPRSSSRSERTVGRDPQDIYDPRLGVNPIPNHPQKYLEALWQHEKIDASFIPSQLKVVSTNPVLNPLG